MTDSTTRAGPLQAGRIVVPMLIGVAVASSLFLLMMMMVSNSDPGLERGEDLGAVNFIRFDREQETRTRDRREPPEEPPPPDQPPPPPTDSLAAMDQPDAPMPSMNMPNIDVPMNIDGGPYIGQAAAGGGGGGIDTEAVATVRVPPVYPRQAAAARIEGYVTMEFTIGPDGSVSDVEVVDADPPRLFDAAATRALSRWRFQPRTVDGENISRRARQTLRFTLD